MIPVKDEYNKKLIIEILFSLSYDDVRERCDEALEEVRGNDDVTHARSKLFMGKLIMDLDSIKTIDWDTRGRSNILMAKIYLRMARLKEGL